MEKEGFTLYKILILCSWKLNLYSTYMHWQTKKVSYFFTNWQNDNDSTDLYPWQKYIFQKQEKNNNLKSSAILIYLYHQNEGIFGFFLPKTVSHLEWPEESCVLFIFQDLLFSLSSPAHSAFLIFFFLHILSFSPTLLVSKLVLFYFIQLLLPPLACILLFHILLFFSILLLVSNRFSCCTSSILSASFFLCTDLFLIFTYFSILQIILFYSHPYMFYWSLSYWIYPSFSFIQVFLSFDTILSLYSSSFLFSSYFYFFPLTLHLALQRCVPASYFLLLFPPPFSIRQHLLVSPTSFFFLLILFSP